MSSDPSKKPKEEEEEEEEEMEEGMDSEEEDPLGEEEEEEGEGEGEGEGDDDEEEEEDMEDEEEEEQEQEDASSKERVAWIDLEMTGSDVETEAIMEIAVVVTDSILNMVAESPNLFLKVDSKLIENMQSPFKEQHTKTGLIEKSKKSTLTLKAAEDQVMEFLEKHTEKDMAPLGGDSIYGEKKKFLTKYMPRVMEHLQDRVVDVKSVKELCRSWYPDEFKSAPTPNESNTMAVERAKESIEELKYFKATLCNAVNVKL